MGYSHNALSVDFYNSVANPYTTTFSDASSQKTAYLISQIIYQLLPLPTYLLMILSQIFCIDLLLVMFWNFHLWKQMYWSFQCSNTLHLCIRRIRKKCDLWIMSFEIKLASPYCNKVFWKTKRWVRFLIVYIADPSL